jgi:hypothetical protein
MIEQLNAEQCVGLICLLEIIFNAQEGVVMVRVAL